jgi:nucleoid-associated protein YgaU
VANDAKFGMILGIGLVIAVSVVFFRKDVTGALSGSEDPINAVSAETPPAPKATGVEATTTSGAKRARQHVVEAGDTLFTIAKAYYGDGARFVDLFQANRSQVKDPERLEPGVVLTIPSLD